MKTYKMIGIAIGTMIAGAAITLAVLNPNNYAETSEDGGAYNLYTRHYDLPYHSRSNTIGVEEKPHEINEIERILSNQKTYGRSWKIVDTKIENDSAIIKAEVPGIFFTDDLEVQIRFAPEEISNSSWRKAVVNVRSASRFGTSDLGENRRHIEQLLDAFDFAFGNDRINL